MTSDRRCPPPFWRPFVASWVDGIDASGPARPIVEALHAVSGRAGAVDHPHRRRWDDTVSLAERCRIAAMAELSHPGFMAVIDRSAAGTATLVLQRFPLEVVASHLRPVAAEQEILRAAVPGPGSDVVVDVAAAEFVDSVARIVDENWDGWIRAIGCGPRAWVPKVENTDRAVPPAIAWAAPLLLGAVIPDSDQYIAIVCGGVEFHCCRHGVPLLVDLLLGLVVDPTLDGLDSCTAAVTTTLLDSALVVGRRTW